MRESLHKKPVQRHSEPRSPGFRRDRGVRIPSKTRFLRFADALLIILLLGHIPGLSQGLAYPEVETVFLRADLLNQEIDELSWIIKDTEENLTPADLRSNNLRGAEIIELTKGEPYEMGAFISYWYKLVLVSEQSSANDKLNVNFRGGYGAFVHTFDSVQAYFYQSNQLIKQALSGLGVGRTGRDVKQFYFPSLISFDIEEGVPLEIWVRVKLDAAYPITIANSIVSRRSSEAASFQIDDTTHFVNGVLGTFLIIGVFMVWWFREKIYWWFIVFILVNMNAQYVWVNAQWIIDTFFSEHPYTINRLATFSDLLKFGFTLYFTRIFVNTKEDFPKVDWAMKAGIGVIAFILVISNWCYREPDPWLMQPIIIMPLAFAWLLMLIGAFTYLIIFGGNLARFYSIGAITPFVGILIVMIAGNMGATYFIGLAEFFIGAGSILALGLAMVYRFKIVVEEKLAAERESKKVLTEMNEKLEEKVTQRTSELSNSLEQLKSTQTQLIHSEKMASLGELTAGIAHEIQNPLNFVNNFSDINKELVDELEEEIDQGNKEEVKAILKDIRDNEEKVTHHGKRAEEIVKSMLQHSRGSEGVKELTDINALCDEFLRLAYHGFRAKDKSFNCDYKLELDPDLPNIEVVPQDIGRVLLNLINNAFQAVAGKSADGHPEPVEGPEAESDASFDKLKMTSPSNLTVTVSTKYSPLEGGGPSGPGGVKITISDNGPGVPDEIKDKIFQPFFTTKDTGQGTGLGLSLSYDIITKGHGGTLVVNSDEGKGAEFVITLPVGAT